MGMLFEVNIAFNPVDLLKQNPNIVEKAVEAFSVSSLDYYHDRVADELADYYGQDFNEAYNESYLSFADYITVKENTVEFDLEESLYCMREYNKTIAFKVDIDFDDKRYMEDLRKEYEDRIQEKE